MTAKATSDLTHNVKLFIQANRRSAVISGGAFQDGGGHYRLNSGREFTLDLAECRSLPEGFPRWKV